MNRYLLSAFAAAAALAAAGAARAQSGSDANLNLSLGIGEGCVIKFDGNINFPAFSALSRPLEEQGRLIVYCSMNRGGAVSVSLDQGSVNGGDKTSARYLYLNGAYSPSGKDRLHFQIYQGNSRVVWAGQDDPSQLYKIDVKGGTYVSAPFTAVLEAQPVNGLSAGNYSNTLTATVSWPDNG